MRKGSYSEELVKIDLHVENPSLPPRSTEGTVTRRGVAPRERRHQVKLNLRKGIRAISLRITDTASDVPHPHPGLAPTWVLLAEALLSGLQLLRCHPCEVAILM